MAKIGTIIENKYEILTEIGHGGMSVVYLAIDRRLNKQWAVKEIRHQKSSAADEIAFQSLIKEANLMKQLDHPFLPRIVDIIEEEDTIYVVMDYIEGSSLDAVLKERGTIDQDIVIEWAKQICDALSYLHSRKPAIIYRDMKPANVILRPEGTIKIIDFGIAREFKEDNIQDTVSLGTRGYAAPEQYSGKGQTDPRTDIYSLGITLYQLVTGKNPTEPPYEIYPIRYWNPTLSGGFENIILKCTQADPNERYQNCDELMYALEHYQEIDDEYIRKQRKKVLTCSVMAIFSMVFLLLSVTFNYLSDKNRENDYLGLIEAAQKEMDYSKQEELYIQAIHVLPGNIQAYEELITLYKSNDSKYTSEEAASLVGLINGNQEALKQNMNDYVELCYDIGKLYWFHYDYGNTQDNQLTRSKSAINWFDNVVKYCENGDATHPNLNVARIFRDIGIFHRDYSINIREASGKGTYIKHFLQLGELLDFLEQNGNEDELVLWEAYKSIVYSLETYTQKFKSDGVSKEEFVAMCERIRRQVENLSATDEITISIEKYIDEVLDAKNGTMIEKVTAAYSEKVG